VARRDLCLPDWIQVDWNSRFACACAMRSSWGLIYAADGCVIERATVVVWAGSKHSMGNEISEKQAIYQQMLRWVLICNRNDLSFSARPTLLRLMFRKRLTMLRNAYERAQLVHNLYVSLFEPEFTSHDIHFLNIHARSFVENNAGCQADGYSEIVALIDELFAIVPDGLRPKLTWDRAAKS
jgi:hypothetical protein